MVSWKKLPFGYKVAICADLALSIVLSKCINKVTYYYHIVRSTSYEYLMQVLVEEYTCGNQDQTAKGNMDVELSTNYVSVGCLRQTR